MIVEGSVVKSAAGRDSGRFFVVLGLEGGYALIADGKLRKLNHPKRKKLMHLKKTNTVIDLSLIRTDNALKRALMAFNAGAETM